MKCRSEPKTVAEMTRELKAAKRRNAELELALLHLCRLYNSLAADWLPETLDAIELDTAKAKSMCDDLHRVSTHVTRVYDTTQREGESQR